VCWSGSGRTENPDHGDLATQVHTANNRGSLRLIVGGVQKDLPFGRYQTHNLAPDTHIIGISLNE
jgi:hypothetical protein